MSVKTAKSDLGWSIFVGKSEAFLWLGLFFPEDDMCERIQLVLIIKSKVNIPYWGYNMYFAIFVTLNYRDDRDFPENILYATV